MGNFRVFREKNTDNLNFKTKYLEILMQKKKKKNLGLSHVTRKVLFHLNFHVIELNIGFAFQYRSSNTLSFL